MKKPVRVPIYDPKQKKGGVFKVTREKEYIPFTEEKWLDILKSSAVSGDNGIKANCFDERILYHKSELR